MRAIKRLLIFFSAVFLTFIVTQNESIGTYNAGGGSFTQFLTWTIRLFNFIFFNFLFFFFPLRQIFF